MNKEINISDVENFNLYFIGFVGEESTHKIVTIKPKLYVTMAVLDIIHRPVLYLKLNSTPYLTGNPLRLRYESNSLMLSIGS
jgi:hypothetical protein